MSASKLYEALPLEYAEKACMALGLSLRQSRRAWVHDLLGKGLTTPQVIERTGLPKSTVYDYQSEYLENRKIVRKNEVFSE